MRTIRCAGVPLAMLLAAASAVSCGNSDEGSTGDTTPPGDAPRAGEICIPPDPGSVKIRWEPSTIVVAPGKSREAKLVVDPDFCDPAAVSFTVDDGSIAAPPANTHVSLHHPTIDATILGSATGTAKITAQVARGDGTMATADLVVDVRSDDLPACSGTASGTVKAGGALEGTGGLAGASLALPAGAANPNAGSFLWHVDDFDASIACANDMMQEGYTALGPAVSFTPTDAKDWSFPREIPITIPVNPARMPEAARFRHVEVWFESPKFPTPRMIPVANPRFTESGGAWRLSFMAASLGTFQAVVKSDAGTHKRTRHLTHRAVIGVSMGGGGSAMFGARHHDLFDVMAPLGGPVDWTWLLHYIENNHLGGFLPNDGDNAPATTIDVSQLAPPDLPYEHRQTFNQWWYEYPKSGNGGTFARSDYIQIFRDLALQFGNPNSQNDAPGAENLPAGVPPDDKSVVGDHPGRECAVTIDPIDTDPNVAKEKELAQQCPTERCSHTLVLQNYYDDEYNPKGTWPVITVCDGAPQDQSKSPWANTWSANGNDYPLELALAVDYNGNGVRDENEPIIRSGHENWQDVGTDGKASKDEPGYQPGVNEDPSGDDYHPQLNPNGTEGNGRYDDGEPFADDGLDGVPNTPAAGKAYDHGEGDGKFTASKGLEEFWKRDTRSILHQWVVPPGGPMDDAALSRTDWWTDGGTRDLFNFAVDAQHLVGSLVGRGRNAAYYTSTQYLPGQDPSTEKTFVPGAIPWEDVPGVVLYRYGHVDPSSVDIADGSGQHVGTADEIARRLESALYFIGSRWPDAPHQQFEVSKLDPAPDAEKCTVFPGNCTFDFTSSNGRTGPVGITLPPGYANAKLQDVRYPVIYLLHGYGQGPEDLEAAIVFLSNWMNGVSDSMASRLSKAILVYVDGRCRTNTDGSSECLRGTFFTDSVRASGAQDESWWLELMKYVDDHYRTMGPSDVEVTD